MIEETLISDRYRLAAASVIAAVLFALPVATSSADASGTIRLANRTPSNLTLSVDGSYGCQALAADQYYPEKTCQAAAAAGQHNLLVTNADGASARDTCDLAEGGTFTWTITE